MYHPQESTSWSHDFAPVCIILYIVTLKVYIAEKIPSPVARFPQMQVSMKLFLVVEVHNVIASFFLIQKVVTLKYDKGEA